ncbi:MAG: hypothetical protein IPO83_16685 [Chitinophagaceae bacterium]|nr:hypothetical protein [Chitinophagaceae bacterium]
MNNFHANGQRKSLRGKCFAAAFSFLMMLISFQHSFSQGNIAAEQVDIVKAYQPLLADAEKIDFNAEPALTDTSMTTLSYDVKPHLIEVPFIPAEIRAVSLPVTEPVALQNNFLKAGFGMQLTPLIDLHLHNGNSKSFSYGLNLHHLSSNGSKIDYQDFSHTGIDLFGSAYVGGSVLSATAGYDFRKNYNYAEAVTDSTDNDKQDLKRTYILLPFEIGFQNTNNKNNINYHFGFKYYHFDWQSNNSFLLPEKEDYFNFNFLLQKQIQKIHSANLEFTYENLHDKLIGVYDTAQSLLSVVPYYQFKQKNILIQAGVNVNVFDKAVSFFPRLHGEYKLIGEYLIPYIGWEGGWKPNTLPEITTVNPYLVNTSSSFSKFNDVFLGIKGSYGNNISYNLRGGFRSQTNLPVYLPDQINPAYYNLEYYYNLNIINVHAEIAYRQSERINVVLSGEANSYDMDFDDQPWGIPKSQLDLTLNYNLQNKIFAQVDFFANSGAYTILPSETTSTQLKGRADVNISLTYDYKKNISGWLAFNNIFGAKNTAWFNYPTYGFQAMVGVNLKF